MSTTSAIGGAVKVIHGASDGVFPVAGHGVHAVRASLVDAFNIPADAISFMNGEQVSETYILRSIDTLEFCKQRGNKGIRRLFTKAEIRREYTGYPDDVLDEFFASVRHDDVSREGQAVWHEAVVDGWLDERYTRNRADDGRDKAIPPNSVRINGVVCSGLTLNEWRLMDALLSSDKGSMMVDDAIDLLYANDASIASTGNRLKQALKRLNQKSTERRWPFTVHVENGWVSLDKQSAPTVRPS